jgi:hypothetical protein
MNTPSRKINQTQRYLFWLLGVFWLIYPFFSVDQNRTIKYLAGAVFLLVVFLFLINLVFSISRFGLPHSHFLVIFAVYGFLLLSLITIARGLFSINVDNIITFFGHPEIGGLVWLLPFAMFMYRGTDQLFRLLPIFKMHAIFGIFLSMFTFYSILSSGRLAKGMVDDVGVFFLYGASFALLLNLGKRRDHLLYLISIFVLIGLSIVISRRIFVFHGVAVLLMYLLLRNLPNTWRHCRKILLRRFLLVFALFVFVYIGVGGKIYSLDDDSEWMVDTRSFIVLEMTEDLSTSDWLFGRGALGRYYSPYFESVEGGDSPHRQISEIGYLHLALKAGALSVIMYLLIYYFAIINALRKYEPRFALGLCSIFIIQIFEMFIIGSVSFIMQQLVLWLLLGMTLFGATTKFRKT